MAGVGRLARSVTCAAFGFHSTSHRRLNQPAKTVCGTAYQDIISTDGNSSFRSPLSLNLQELSDELKGSGRAAVVWDCLRAGIDPNLYYSSQGGKDDSDDAIADAWIKATACAIISGHDVVSSGSHDERNILGRREGQGLGTEALKRLQKLMHDYHRYNNYSLRQSGNTNGQHKLHGGENAYTIENSIASLSHMNVSPDGTTKLLLKMRKDGLEVESVIIPWMDKGFSTLCVSMHKVTFFSSSTYIHPDTFRSQVGCKQGCTFCATGRMGKLRSLTTDEILVQVYYAFKVCRVVRSIISTQNNILPKVDNIVYMGMGEPADNAESVVRAAQILVDRRLFGLAQSKVTISTVAPNPSAFHTLGKALASLAWSVHAVDDQLRRRLVPTTKNTMEELRCALVNTLRTRSIKLRRTMLEVALIEGVNDSDEDAKRLAAFSKAIMNDVERSKVVVNLIPYNAIDHPTYRTPSMETVLGFQKIVVDGGVLCYVRTTRGDDESAACGQLATKRTRP
ncbi:LOW QUALITY PROTEIN: hypothetical protein ACHAW5_007983 [Stephanodiscus triporus]|uniref:Radical SAM core domain-containing protein n=1 Tax=Stephanodiscus triporus TaxID=2934178 RepID=A0ABD3R604_9STRA